MNLYFRFLWLLVRSLFTEKNLSLLDKCTTSFMVNPLDLDLNFHMNNGRYLSIMDLARTDLMIKAGVFKKLFSKGYYPVVLSESITFKRSLELFQIFEIEAAVNAWNEKDFYLTQTFKYKNQIVAEGIIKGRFLRRGQKGSIPTHEIFEAVNLNLDLIKETPVAAAHHQVGSLLAPKTTT